MLDPAVAGRTSLELHQGVPMSLMVGRLSSMFSTPPQHSKPQLEDHIQEPFDGSILAPGDRILARMDALAFCYFRVVDAHCKSNVRGWRI